MGYAVEFLTNVKPLALFSDQVLVLLRAFVGLTFAYYGWPKIKNLRSNAKDFVSMGYKPGWFWGTLVAFLEFFGGLALAIGCLSGLLSALFAIQMSIGTVWKITETDKSFTDWSYDVLLLFLMLILLAFGSGPSFFLQ